MSTLSPDPAILERVRALVPALAEQAPEAEELRRPTDASIEMLERSGVFRMMVPERFGGLELDLDTFVETGLALGEADTSIAWITTFYIEHNWMLCQFPESFQQSLYTEQPWVLAPGVVAPTGQATPENGGHRLSGRWQWGTGCMHGDWVIVGASTDPENPGAIHFFALPRSDTKVEDTWYVDGMVGTGSNDIVVDGAFVPSDRSVDVAAMVNGTAEGARLHQGPLYRTPMIPILMIAASTPVVGQARAVVRGFRERLSGQTRMLSPVKQAARPSIQMRLARAEIEQTQAEATLRAVVSDVMAKRNQASLEDRARWAASISHALHQSRRVIENVAQASGASAHFSRDPLQRAVRDANVASCHIAFDADARAELYGRLLLGHSPTVALF